jgi:hypothetical protein
MQLGYLKVTVDPVNNTATAWEVTVAKLSCWECPETPELYNPPVINDTITFHLKPAPDNPPAPNSSYNLSKTMNKEQIKIGNMDAEAYESGKATNNINIAISQGPGSTIM